MTTNVALVPDNPLYDGLEITPNLPLKQNNLPHKTALMDGIVRVKIKPGMLVAIILKKDQRSGVLTEGAVQHILTSAPKHHRGIKVRLEDDQMDECRKFWKKGMIKPASHSYGTPPFVVQRP